MGELIAGIVGLVVVFGIAVALNAIQCSAKYSDSGMNHEYGIISGCRVEVDGKLIPEDKWRSVE